MVQLNAQESNIAKRIDTNIQRLGYKNENFSKAVIANAYAESKLKPDALGDGGHSVGLFQLNKQGAAKGLSHDQFEQLKDPDKNTMHLFQQEKGNIDKIYQKAQNGADAGELAKEFTVKVERPANKFAEGQKRAEIAKTIQIA